MTEISGCNYADNLLDRFKSYAGRIGLSCDDCDLKDCHHHKDNMKVEALALAIAFREEHDNL